MYVNEPIKHLLDGIDAIDDQLGRHRSWTNQEAIVEAALGINLSDALDRVQTHAKALQSSRDDLLAELCRLCPTCPPCQAAKPCCDACEAGDTCGGTCHE